LEAIESIARAHEAKPSTVALRWLLDAGEADVAIVGPRDDAQLAEFLTAGTCTINTAALRQLTQVSEPETTYPRNFTDAFARTESPLYGGLPNFGRSEDTST
jgi:aryl-alcohol dehydrogenase-like predicted oxidoreductase